MTADMKLVGFVSELTGMEDQLFEADPVVSVNGRVYAAQGLGWKVSELVPVAASDVQYIHFVRANDQVAIAEGQSVWLVGQAFFSGAQTIERMHQVRLQIGAWKATSRGFRWSIGFNAEFVELSETCFNHLEESMHNYLFDHLEKSHGAAKFVYSLLSTISVKDRQRQEVDRGLFFREIRDNYSYEFVRSQATIESTFETAADFDAAVDGLTKFLDRDRLSEPGRRSAVSATAVLSPYEHAIKTAYGAWAVTKIAPSEYFQFKASESQADLSYGERL